MKKKYLFITVLMLALVTFTSCLDDKDNDEDKTVNLSKQEIALRNMILHGTWEGKIYYLNAVTNKADSVAAIWTGDSVSKTITFEHFPVRLLADYTDGELKQILKDCGDQPLVFKYNSPSSDFTKNVNMQYFWYGFAPENNKATFYYNNEEITITFADALTDYMTTYRPIATYYQQVMQANILFGDIDYNKKTYTLNRLFSVGGNKIRK